MNNSESENERRHYKRIAFIAEVLMQKDDRQWTCGLEDISLKGMLVLAPESVKAQQNAVYSVELVLGEGVSIKIQARISHITENNWGLQWENIDLDGLTHLRRLLELNMADSAEIHRELADLG